MRINLSGERLLPLLIAVVVMGLGASILIDGYAPGRFTRFAYSPELTGSRAQSFGVVLILLGTLPLLSFCKDARQATRLGPVLGVLLLAVIFIAAYA